MLGADIHPVDILLLWAASENDTPKVAELLRAGADVSAKVHERLNPQPTGQQLASDEAVCVATAMQLQHSTASCCSLA